MCFAYALWPNCTSHHAVLSACHLSIHPPCQYPLPVFSSPPILWPHHRFKILLLLIVEALLVPFCASYFPFIYPANRFIFSLRLRQSRLLFHSSLILSSFHLFPFPQPSILPAQPPFSLPVCSDRFCGSRAGCVNVKPFPAMIMFITRCVSRCPWINTNWRSTLQR